MGVSDVLSVSRLGQGRSIQRAITAKALATIRNVEPEKILRQAWPRDEGAAAIVKGAVSPTSTADFVGHDQVGAFRSLAPGSAALKLFDQSVKLDLAGIALVRIPRVAGLPTQPIFIGEGQPAPVVQFTNAATTLGPARKIIVLSGVTRELNEATPETAASVIGTVLADASNASIDKTAFDANPADATRPAGLLHGTVPLAASTGTDAFTAIAEDLGNLVAAIGAAGIDPSDAIFVAGPREAMILQMLSGSNFTNDVLMTLGLPAKSVACFAPAAVYSGYQDVPQIETRNDVALHFEDTAPLPIVGSPGTVAAPTKSLWQQEIIAIRVRANAAWACAPGAAQIVENVSW